MDTVIYQQFQSLQFGLHSEISLIAYEDKCGITDQYLQDQSMKSPTEKNLSVGYVQGYTCSMQ